MSFQINSNIGVSSLAGIDTSSIDVEVLLPLVLAENQKTAQNKMRAQVEEMAQSNERARVLNQSLTTITSFMGDIKGDTSTSFRDNFNSANNLDSSLSASDMTAYKSLLTNVMGTTPPGSVLEALTANTHISAEGKAYLMGRAQLADIAMQLNLLPDGGKQKFLPNEMKDFKHDTYLALALGSPTKGVLDTLKNGIKAAADNISNNSQLAMINLQKCISESDAAKTGLTQSIKTIGDGKKEIMQKL